MPFSAAETGQFSFASSAAATNDSSVIPGTTPVTSSADVVIPSPGTNVTVAETSSRSGGVPAFAKRAENAIEKQDACAAAISSSGLVIPPSSPVRAAQETASGPNAPLPTCSIVPEPFSRSPFQLTRACLSAIASSSLAVPFS